MDRASALVRQYLLYKGYPEGAVVAEYPVGSRRADLAIVDTERGQPIAVFEVKSGPDREGLLRRAASELAVLKRELLPLDVTTYAVHTVPERGMVQVYEYTGQPGPDDSVAPGLVLRGPPDFEVPGDVSTEVDLPSYAEARDAARGRSMQRVSEERRRTWDWFKLLAWGASLAAFILFLLDVLDIFRMEPRQFALLGAAVALAVAPFASKLSILGFEFQRLLSPGEEIEEGRSKGRMEDGGQ